MLDFDFIETPEHVELERKLAGIGSRFAAGLLDTLVIAGIYLVLLLAFLGIAWTGVLAPGSLLAEAEAWGVAILIFVGFFIYWGYFVFFEMRTNGQSPGKKLLKIRVVKDGGGAVTFTDIAVRNLLRIVDAIGVYAVAGVCMFFTKKAQRLGDLAAATVVVSEATSDYSAQADRRTKVQWEREASPEALRSTGLRPEEYRALSNYLARRGQLTLEARQRLLVKLVRPILERHGQLPPDELLGTLEYHLDLLMGRAASAEQQPGCQDAPGEGST